MARWHGNHHAWIDVAFQSSRRWHGISKSGIDWAFALRLRPKLQETALALWTIYIILTALEILLLWGVGGMTIFDAFNHGLTTMPSGGSQLTMLRLRITIVSL